MARKLTASTVPASRTVRTKSARCTVKTEAAGFATGSDRRMALKATTATKAIATTPKLHQVRALLRFGGSGTTNCGAGAAALWTSGASSTCFTVEMSSCELRDSRQYL